MMIRWEDRLTFQSSASSPAQETTPSTTAKKLSEISPNTNLPFSHATSLVANHSNNRQVSSTTARSPTTTALVLPGDILLRPQPPPRRIPPKPLPTTTNNHPHHNYPIRHRMLTFDDSVNENGDSSRALIVSSSDPSPSMFPEHAHASPSVYCRSQSEIITPHHAPLPPIPVDSPNVDAKKPKKKGKGFFSKVFTTTSKHTEQRWNKTRLVVIISLS